MRKLWHSLLRVGLCVVFCGLAVAGTSQRLCVPRSDKSTDTALVVAAAAEVNSAITEAARVFEQKTGRHIRFTFADSSSLYSQIRNGAPFDAFFSADLDYPRRLAASGATVNGSATAYARDRIVLCISPMARVELPPRDPLTVLRNKAISHIAISDPQRTIAGRATLRALRTAHIYDFTVQRKLLVGDDSSQVAQFVQNGSADVALLPSSAIRAYSLSGTRMISIPASLAPAISMGAVVLKRSKHRQEALGFLKFTTLAEGEAIFRRYGFEPAQRAGAGRKSGTRTGKTSEDWLERTGFLR